MKTPTDFAYAVTRYLSQYLPGTVGLSANSIRSYRDTFRLLLTYCAAEHHLPPEQITLARLDRPMIEDFLAWLESARACSLSTRNQRLAALHAFFKYLQRDQPQALCQYQQILAIPMKKVRTPTIAYLTREAITLLLEMPSTATSSGRRDAVLLSLLYDSGARVQELADLRVGDVRLQAPATIKLTGKGQKTRIVPLMAPMARLLGQYFSENNFHAPQCQEYPLFRNRAGNHLTRSGIAFILDKYCTAAKTRSPGYFGDAISPHVIRHSKAMHLLQAGVNLIYIRDLLGHVNVQTTEIYAKADSSMKRMALEQATGGMVSEEMPEWQKNADLLAWLQGLGR
jgi:site-specific recombinase XerD